MPYTQPAATGGGSGEGIPVAVAAGTVDVITADFTPDISLADKTLCAIVASGANTSTTPTFNPDGLGALVITKQGGVALVAGDIPGALAVCILEYNLANTRWELLNPALNATNVAAAGASMVLPNIAGLADDSYIAFEMETISVGETGTIGQTFYLKAADHLWYKADYNAAATATTPLVMLVGTMTFGEGSATGVVLKRGFLRDDGGFAAWADGAPLFVGVSGALDDDEPTGEDDISRFVGYFKTDGAKRIVEFKPSPEWTVVAVP